MFPLIAENLVVEFKGQRILGPIGLKLVKGDIAVILGPNYPLSLLTLINALLLYFLFNLGKLLESSLLMWTSGLEILPS